MAYQNRYAVDPLNPIYAETNNRSAHQSHSEGRSDFITPDARGGRQDPLDRYAQGAAQRAGVNGRAGRQGDPARVRAKVPRNDHPGSHVRPYDNRSPQSGNPQYPPQYERFQYPRQDGGSQYPQSLRDLDSNNAPYPVRDQYVDQATEWQEDTHGVKTPYEYASPPAEEAASWTHPYRTQPPVRTTQRQVPSQEKSQPTAVKHNPPPDQQQYKHHADVASAGLPTSSPYGHFDASATGRPGTASRQRILDDISPPDTVSWDNPFPSFPAARKRKEQTTPRNELADPMGKLTVGADSNNHQAQSSRPQTAGSKSSYGPSSSDYKGAIEKEVFVSHSEARLGPSSPPQAVPPSGSNLVTGIATHQNAYSNRQAMDHRREPMAWSPDNGLRSPPPAIRHSEEHDRAPGGKHDFTPISDVQRSRTMPNALVRPEPEYWNLPASPISPIWQEQGPTAGYYGPVDKAFLSNTEDDGPNPETQNAPLSPSERNQLVGGRSRPPAVTKNSFVDVYDSYSESPGHGSHSTQHDFDSLGQAPIRERMLNPADQDLKQVAHRRGLTIDKHLEPGHDPGSLPPIPKPYHKQEDGNPWAKDPRGNYMPRSRSQPDLKDRRPPPGSENSHFDFQLPHSPPATAPAPLSKQGQVYRPSGSQKPQSRDQQAQSRAVTRDNSRPPPMNGYSNGSQRSREQPYGKPMTQPRSNGYQHSTDTDCTDAGLYPSDGPGTRRGSMSQPPPDVRNWNDPRSFASNNSRNWRGPTSPPPVNGAANGDRHINSRPSANNIRGPTSLSPGAAKNPDALPAHPAPMRSDRSPQQVVRPAPNRGPALDPYAAHPTAAQNTSRPPPVRNYNHEPRPVPGLPGQNARPPPIRNYQYDTPPGPVTNGFAEGKVPRRDQKRQLVPITNQELQRRRQAATVNPGNLEAQFLFAKGLAEAASVLVESVDPKSKGRERDGYNGEALRVLKKLVSEQYSEAMFFLGDCYSQGRLGLAMDAKEAFTLYQSAAKSGHAASAFRVAVCCEMGLEEGGGTQRDLQKAIQWYTRAATLGDTPAMYKVGIIQLKGLLSQPINPTEALVWLGKAAQRADTENPHALHELSLLYESGLPSVPADPRHSLDCLTAAANLGYKFSQYRLGRAYEYGLITCAINPRQSIAWYSKAAVQEEHQAELALSGWYLTGSDGILQQSDTEAYLWARKAAMSGLAKAEFAMGYFTEVGIGAPASLEEAKRWYWRSASQNFPKARERLEDLRKGGPKMERNRVSRSTVNKQQGDCTIM